MNHSHFQRRETKVVSLPDGSALVVEQASAKVQYLIALWDETASKRDEAMREVDRLDAALTSIQQQLSAVISGEREQAHKDMKSTDLEPTQHKPEE